MVGRFFAAMLVTHRGAIQTKSSWLSSNNQTALRYNRKIQAPRMQHVSGKALHAFSPNALEQYQRTFVARYSFEHSTIQAGRLAKAPTKILGCNEIGAETRIGRVYWADSDLGVLMQRFIYLKPKLRFPMILIFLLCVAMQHLAGLSLKISRKST
jgi:hypothetical protein